MVARRAGVQLADDRHGRDVAVALDRRRRYDLSRRNALRGSTGLPPTCCANIAARITAVPGLARTGVDPVLVEGHADVVSARVTAAAITAS